MAVNSPSLSPQRVGTKRKKILSLTRLSDNNLIINTL